MRHEFVDIKRIVYAASQQEAEILFTQRKVRGLSGVIFTPEIVFPSWTKAEQDFLASQTFYDGDDTHETSFRPTDEWKRVAGSVCQQWINLSKIFNKSDKSRHVQFFYDDQFIEPPHRDRFAGDGWLHHHLSGSGLICLNPVGTDGIKLKIIEGSTERIDPMEIEELMRMKKIELLTLAVNQAIMFDDTMVHYSGKGERFRAATFG